MESDIKKTAALFKALGDENRIRILHLLSGGEKCACKLLEALSVTQPTLSHHMKILCDSGIVKGRKEGKWMHYSISQEGVDSARRYLDAMTAVNAAKEEKPCCE
ncbi:MAG: winged helix-turn-helix transcriptional regulator [Ruminococcus sp.]|nr:winged helix-turn-helix transcriptional regulator [Ruminococcus sp.]